MWALKQGAEVSGTLREMRKEETTPKRRLTPRMAGRLAEGERCSVRTTAEGSVAAESSQSLSGKCTRVVRSGARTKCSEALSVPEAG